MFKKIKKLWIILKFFFEDEDNLFLHLIEMKAMESLEDCITLGVSSTEEIEDLLFHLRLYYDIPESLIETKYPQFKGWNWQEIIKEYKRSEVLPVELVEVFSDFIIDVETERALEREIIFEHAKCLSFGFKL